MTFTGKISEAKDFLNRCYLKFKDKEVVIDIDLWKDKRTLQQNKYLWVLFTLIGKELGYDKDEAKYWILTHIKFTKEITNKKTGEIVTVPKETRDLNYDDFYSLTAQIMQFAQSYGIAVQTPQEYFNN